MGPLSPKEHWAHYLDTICRASRCRGLKALPLSRPIWHNDLPRPEFRVQYHIGCMNDRPYVVAAVGDIMASPAAIWLRNNRTRRSALARLYDVFRIGDQGSAYQELLERRMQSGQRPEGVQAEWNACQRAVLWEMKFASVPSFAPQEVPFEWRVCDSGVQRESRRGVILARRMGL